MSFFELSHNIPDDSLHSRFDVSQHDVHPSTPYGGNLAVVEFLPTARLDVPPEHTPPAEAADEITETLGRAGVRLVPISVDDAAVMGSRDFGGEYPYLAQLPQKYGDSLSAIGVAVDGHLVGYGVSGVFEQDGKLVGEVGMTHISPQVRNLGLFSVLQAAAHIQILHRQPDELYVAIGDTTGKVSQSFAALGYTDRQQYAYHVHPTMGRSLEAGDREALAAQLQEIAASRAERLLTRSDELHAAAAQVERDNPWGANVPAVVEQRLAQYNVFSQADTVNYFGYDGAPLRIGRSPLVPEEGYGIELDVHTPYPEEVADTFAAYDPEAFAMPLQSPVLGKEVGVRLATGRLTMNEERLHGSLRDYAEAARDLLQLPGSTARAA